MIEAGKQYKHFKGGLYTVLTHARFVTGSEDKHVVVYQGSDGRAWVRDYEDFTGLVVPKSLDVTQKVVARFVEVE